MPLSGSLLGMQSLPNAWKYVGMHCMSRGGMAQQHQIYKRLVVQSMCSSISVLNLNSFCDSSFTLASLLTLSSCALLLFSFVLLIFGFGLASLFGGQLLGFAQPFFALHKNPINQ